MVKTITTSKVSLASTARSSAEPTSSDSASFGAAAIGMGWQLAIVVLVPIVGGYKLDEHLGSSPLWTLIGLVLSLVGSILVIRRALQAFGNFAVSEPADAPKDVVPAESKEKTS